jgi:hypothetical protein
MKTAVTLAATFLAFASLSLVAAGPRAEWEIVEVRTSPFTRTSYSGPPEMQMDVVLRNTSDRKILVFGETWRTRKYYQIEAFIQTRGTQVWERQNSGMSGSDGQIGWIEVRAGETIRCVTTLRRDHSGEQMLLTFRRAYSAGDARGSEILLGPFPIPEPPK